MPETGKRGDDTSYQPQRRREVHAEGATSPPPKPRSSPAHRPPRVLSLCPRVSPNPAEKEKTGQHGTAKKSQASKSRGIRQIKPKHTRARQSQARNTKSPRRNISGEGNANGKR